MKTIELSEFHLTIIKNALSNEAQRFANKAEAEKPRSARRAEYKEYSTRRLMVLNYIKEETK